MKKDVAEFMAKCLICQEIEAEDQAAAGKLQPLPIPVWKWERITMDFVTALPKTQRKHDAIWVIVDRLTKSAHFIPIRLGISLNQLATEYVNEVVRLHGVPISIVSDRVFLKVSPWKGIIPFGQKGKLRPRYIGPYEITERIGSLAYRLALPAELAQIHNVFHVSMLWRYRSDPTHVFSEPT